MNLNPGFIERYQIIFEKDKSTQLFAPLAEAYRKMGLLKQALEVCESGLEHHPNFISGLVAYAGVLYDLENYEKAKKVLDKATTQNPDNILAQFLLGKTLLKQKKPKEALNAFKMVLFLAPHHEEAGKQVKKLEALSATEINEDLFKLNPLSLFEEIDEDDEAEDDFKQESIAIPKHLKIERMISLSDAFSVRGDLDRAIQILNSAREQFGDKPEIIKRLRVLDNKSISISLSQPEHYQKTSNKVHALPSILENTLG